MQLQNLTIACLRQSYRDGRFTPRELVLHLLEKARQFEHKNIFIHALTVEEIEQYLDRLDPTRIDSLPLWGVPFVVKDNIDLGGFATTAACPAFAYTAAEDAFVVKQLIAAGAIPLGKTNLDQFATGLVGTRSPEPWGACRNAFDDDYISGGSSSGSAVAVALGLASFALGTDTAGSGRIPAAFNNLLGLKATRGLLSCSGVVPACKSLDCVSIFASTADDVSLVYEVTAAFDPSDPYARRNVASNRGNYGRYSEDFSFAVPPASQLEFFGDSAAQELFEAAVANLEAIGGTKTECDFSPLFAAARLLYEGPWVNERYLAAETIFSTQPDALLPVIRTIIGSQTGARASDAFRAFYQLQTYKRQADTIVEQYDVLVTPTAGTIYRQAQLADDPVQLNSNLGYYTNFMNLLDYCAVAVPAGFRDDGLPFGISLMADRFNDTRLLALANRWQSHTGLPLGATDWPLPALESRTFTNGSKVDVVVCGAHLQGLPLNWQLQQRGARKMAATCTAPHYRFYALAGGPPRRPGLIRDEHNGSSIRVEVWRLPSCEFGSFVAGIPQPLGIGKVELEDGRWLPGFICEGSGIEGASDITELADWRVYIENPDNSNS